MNEKNTKPPLILVVDDEWMNRELMEAALQTIGYRVVMANSGPVALQLAAEHSPDLALVDVRLRYIDDGYEVCRQLKETFPHTKVIMITALETPDSRAKAQAAGADDFITRSLDIPQFLAYIDNMIHKDTAAS